MGSYYDCIITVQGESLYCPLFYKNILLFCFVFNLLAEILLGCIRFPEFLVYQILLKDVFAKQNWSAFFSQQKPIYTYIISKWIPKLELVVQFNGNTFVLNILVLLKMKRLLKTSLFILNDFLPSEIICAILLERVLVN